MVVDIHGGPTWSAKLSFNPGYALTSFAAGVGVPAELSQAAPGAARPSRGSTSAIRAGASSTTSWPASTGASPRASPIPNGSCHRGRATAAT